GFHIVAPVTNGVEVGQDEGDTGLGVLGEERTAVDDQEPAAQLGHGHTASDLSEPSAWAAAQGVLGHGRWAAKLGRWGAHSRPAGLRPARRVSTSLSVAVGRGARIARLVVTPSIWTAALAMIAPWVVCMTASTAGSRAR